MQRKQHECGKTNQHGCVGMIYNESRVQSQSKDGQTRSRGKRYWRDWQPLQGRKQESEMVTCPHLPGCLEEDGLKQWFSTRASLPPGHIWEVPRLFFFFFFLSLSQHRELGEVLLTSSGQRPTILTILQCRSQPLPRTALGSPKCQQY